MDSEPLYSALGEAYSFLAFFFFHMKNYTFFFFSHEKQVFPVTFWVWTTNVNFISIPTEGLFEEQAVEGGW